MKRLVVFALAFGMLGSFAAGNASASVLRGLPKLTSPGVSSGGALPLVLHARYAQPATHVSTARALAQSAAATTVAMWHRTVTDGGTPYAFSMVGKNPFVAQTNPTTTTPVYLVPVIFTFTSFSNDVFDPTASNACDQAGKSDVTRVENSPMFKTAPWSFGGTSPGPNSQYIDAFQRAEFWSKTKPGSTNPGYNDNLGSPNSHVIPVSVNLSGGDVVAGTCGNVGLIDFSTWDNYVQTQLFPLLATHSPAPPPTSLVIFLFHNVVMFQGSTSNCCILGYHSAFDDPAFGGALQTYATAEYDSSKSFSGVEDIAPLSHEVGEWMNDPLGNNPTPSWGNIGQVSGCQSNLEVGDPLSGTTMRMYMDGFTYHPQELAFFSWFYHENPSIGINRWYSDNDTLESAAAPC